MIPNPQYMRSTTLLHAKWTWIYVGRAFSCRKIWWRFLELWPMSKQTRLDHKAGTVMISIQWYIIRVIALLYSFKRATRRSSSKTITSISGMRCFGPWCHYAFEEFAKLQMNCPAKPPTLIKEALPDLHSLCFPFPSCVVMDAWFPYSMRLTLWHFIIHVLLHRILWHVWIQKFLQSCSSNSLATSCNKKHQ